MVLLAGSVMLLVAGLFAALTSIIMRRELRRAHREPQLRPRDGVTMAIVLLRAITAGGLFGFGLAMVLDRLLGGWGILLATAICACLWFPLCRMPLSVEEA
jgi:hypothetical protein